MTSWTNRRGQVTTFAYDALNALTSRTAGGVTTTYKFAANDRYAVAAVGSNRDSTAFDNAGRPTAQVVKRGTNTYTLTSAWNDRDQRLSLVTSGAISRTWSYKYNAHGQLDTLTDVNAGKTAVVYNGDRQATEYKLLSGVNRTRTLQYPSTHQTGEVEWNSGVLNDAFGTLLTQNALSQISDRYFVGSDTYSLAPSSDPRSRTSCGVDAVESRFPGVAATAPSRDVSTGRGCDRSRDRGRRPP